MAWISIDPECGVYVVANHVATVKTSSGLTLAEEFPESYVEISWWRALLLRTAEEFHAWVAKHVVNRHLDV